MNSGRRSAGIVVVAGEPPDVRYLLLRAYRYWDFPKGEVEAGEDPLETARREVREETGIGRLEFRWGEAYRETEPYAGGKVARYYLAWTPEPGAVYLPVSSELGRPEHHEFRWVTHDEGRRLLNDRVRRVLEWAQERMDEDS